jgi:uncharacterized protein (TIGR03435 family)
MRQTLASSVFGFLIVANIASPGQETPKLEFEAATVRQAPPESAGRFGNVTGGLGSTDPERVRYHGTPLSILLAEAYRLAFDQVVVPDWAHKQGYDIVAKIPPGTTREQYAAMLRNLLIERLHITSHYEKRNFAAYDLVVAKGGVKMKVSTAKPPPAVGLIPADPGAAAVQIQQQFSAQGHDRDGFPSLPDNNIAAMWTNSIQGHTRSNARGQTTAALAQMLERGLGNGVRVADQTGLTGRYDFKLEYGSAVSAASDDPLPDVFSAVQSQLGLKLEKGTGQLDVLVIDHIEKIPTDN